MRLSVSTAIQFLSCLALCSIFFVTAGAADARAEIRGPFVGGGVNGSFEEFDAGIVDFDDAVGLGFRGGFRFDEWVAAEFQYEWSGTFDGDLLSAELDLYYFGVNAKIYPMQTWIQPYALVGVGVLYGYLDTNFGDADETAAAFRFGAGVEIPVLDQLRVTLEAGYVLPTGDLEDFEYATLGAGVVWYFDMPRD
jgi:opacity protein-like surface antigen